MKDDANVSRARSVAEFEAERMTDDERWAAEWWRNNGVRRKVGMWSYVTLPTLGHPRTWWDVDAIDRVKGDTHSGNDSCAEFGIGVLRVELTCTVGQFFALLRLIESLGK